MKAYIITIIKNSDSLDCAEACLKSIKDTDSQLDAQIYLASTPESMFDVNWTWPLEGKKSCINLVKHGLAKCVMLQTILNFDHDEGFGFSQ